MRETTIARNYAEALLALARKANALDGWGSMMSAVSDAVTGDARLTNFLAAPQVSADAKIAVIQKAFGPVLPRPLVLFLVKLVQNRRQMLIPEISVEYANLVDETEGRVHAQVTLARDASEADRAAIAKQLTTRLGKTVVPHVHVNPAILGGIIVKVGDTVMDGSVRKRLGILRSRLTPGLR
ncbi:MAG: F0F1 ATP synthase subunit delta [Gemmatimonadetes bacterium]|jgi:F-type H+-transporting ATPase subunit delta|nr:F0F1 ATP synthase subunit delta [Gemmatimonadota bacterium]MCC7322229.1 F0F1 ATP synthase subunit delta [Gemmatimonadaceae bacterium]MBK6455022.1 F0F1 ATP synthase subunit delta [Gemmatimonadota bacterium]MBK6841205.1 F0F1 ATP synthase subunit delta [Gemmatimonadota bacterium]MBK7834893.1 F0F1 ATP synthase subunit delta [Gemmatimonadota bacterium]